MESDEVPGRERKLSRPLERDAVEELKIELLLLDRGRVLPDPWEEDFLPSKKDMFDGCPFDSFFAFPFSSNLSGTPSHLELTLGTVSGILAADTMNIPALFGRVPCEVCCFCIVSL